MVFIIWVGYYNNGWFYVREVNNFIVVFVIMLDVLVFFVGSKDFYSVFDVEVGR